VTLVPPYDVFLSYSGADRRLAQQLTVDLTDAGLSVWSDLELALGSEWRSEIARALNAATAVVVVISPASLESRSVLSEWSAALQGSQRVIPALAAGATFSDLPGPLAAVQGVDLSRDYPHAVEQIVGAVTGLRTSEAPPASALVDTDALAETVVARVLERLKAEPAESENVASPAESEGVDAGPRLTASVAAAAGELQGQVTAADFARAILRRHPEYGKGDAREFGNQDAPSGATPGAVGAWTDALRSLYRAELLPALHGREAVRGLALLDVGVATWLRDLLPKIDEEIREELRDILTPRGLRLLRVPDSVPTLSDRPSEEDRLGRRAFAQALAARIHSERAQSSGSTGMAESFLVHLHGPWGSGKTSLLNLLESELRKSDWIIVPFNAWQHERLGPPWWHLMTAVQRRAVRDAWPYRKHESETSPPRGLRDIARSLKLVALELMWRIRLGWMAYLLLPAVVALIWLGWRENWFEFGTSDGWLAQVGDIAKPVGAILGLAVTVLGAARGLGRSLSVASSRGADTFLRNTRDPMRTLTRRFNRIVAAVHRPIAIFVDDLDRCQATYVVELLQGIQILLLDAPVTYVIAADGRWLYDSYAKVYRDFGGATRQPGRPLGHLFLEKTFQISAPVPGLSDATRSQFWNELLVLSPHGAPSEMKPEVAAQVEAARTEGELFDLLQETTTGPPEAEQAVRAAIVSRLASPELERRTEHRLRRFAPLLEPNPRAMKRLVNAYGIARDIQILEGRNLGTESAAGPEELALWLVLNSRWPLLADRLAENPGLLPTGLDSDLPEEMKRLWASDDVTTVVNGTPIGVGLTEAAVRSLTGRGPHAPPSRFPVPKSDARTAP